MLEISAGLCYHFFGKPYFVFRVSLMKRWESNLFQSLNFNFDFQSLPAECIQNHLDFEQSVKRIVSKRLVRTYEQKLNK